jgi:hypothetical protein
MHEVQLDLQPHHVLKLAKGHTIQVPHKMIGSGMTIIVKKPKHTRVHRAHRNQKGCRLSLDPEELEMQGEGFWDTLKKIGSFIKDKVFTNPIYKQHVAPLIKQGLNTGIDVLSGLAGSQAPFLAPVVSQIGRAGVSKLGEATGAYGLVPVMAGTRRKGRGSGSILPQSQMAGTFSQHGGPLNPMPPRSDFSAPDYGLPARERGHPVKGSVEAKEWSARMQAAKAAKRGGSFVPAGRY